MSEDSHIKLYIPGPIEVSEKTFRAMCAPMIGHRGGEFKKLYGGIQPRLQELFGTKRPVFLSTSSAWGVMEGSIRNLTKTRVLNAMCGAFSDKWLDVSRRCGRQAEGLQVEWGQPIRPEQVREKLSTGDFDTFTLIHNETSCGIRNPLGEIAKVLRDFPGVLFIVDSVSSFSTEAIPMDELGIDVLLTGSQKALAMPPGLALFSVSERAQERAASVPDRGYYFDFVEFAKNQEQDMTPSTPVIPLIHALASKLDDIFSEGLQNRYARHAALNARVHDWVKARGFEFFAPEGYRSLSLTCVKNNRGVDVAAWIKNLREKHRFAIDGGYGKIKGKTFRISNMGDETPERIDALLAALDDTLG
ncbi:MAG: alanine--glyoxylate aminotransferase family protein [Chthoniobacterales bacterium]|nr:alanine--glyoxylate aminotransferase family protein [Chthoniobacterales bacterium]